MKIVILILLLLITTQLFAKEKEDDWIGCICPYCHYSSDSRTLFSWNDTECPKCLRRFPVAMGRAIYEGFREKIAKKYGI